MKNKNILFVFSLIILIVSNVNSQYFPDWVNTFHPPIPANFSIDNSLIDVSGNIYLSGNFGNGIDYDALIVKFNSFGIYQWEGIYPGYGNENQAFPLKVLLAPNNFIYLIGYCANWTVYSNSIFIMKMDQSGNVINSIAYKRPGTDNTTVKDAVFDNNSNIYLTGDVYNFQIGYDSLLVLKYDQNLNLQWVITKADTISGGNIGHALVTDSQGNLYIAGQIYKSQYNSDCAIFKYTPAGVLSWIQTYRYGNFIYEDAAYDIVLDNNQNIISSGYTRIVNGNDTSVTIAAKINTSGVVQWVNTYNTDSIGFENGNKIIYNGSIYIGVDNTADKRLIKLNDNGNLLWNTYLSGNNNYITADGSGNILYTGYRSGSGFNPLSLGRVNQNGVIDQNYFYSYNFAGRDNGYFIKQFPDNRLLVVGTHDNDLLFLKLSASVTNNVNISRNNLNKPITDFNYTYDTILINTADLPANSIIRDVNVTIDTILHPTDYDLVISISHLNVNDSLSVRRGGTSANYIGTHFNDSAVTNICDLGNPPFTGNFKPCYPLSKFNLYPADGAWILKIFDLRANNTGTLNAWKLNIIYEAPPIGIKTVSSEIPSKFSLSQNYPNPFNPVTKIKFDIPSTLSNKGLQPLVQLKVFDILGREVETLVNQDLQPGIYEVEWNAANYPSGVYYYRLISGDIKETKKMVLLK